MPKADVTIMGAGIFGLSIAWCCQEQGATVQVIDPAGPGAGASGGVVGALAPHVPENWNEKKAFQFESLFMAETFWRKVQETSGLSPGYARLGRLQPVADQRALELAWSRAESSVELWQGKAVWEVIEPKSEGWMPSSPTGYVIRDTLSARLHPRQACLALVAAIQARGGTVVKQGTQQGKIVWATGVTGLEELTQARGRMVGNGVKGQAAVLQFSAPDMPQLFVDSLHIIPHENGTVAVGSTSERVYDTSTQTDEKLDEIITRAALAVPVLHGARVVQRWAGLRPRTRSRAPMLGAHPLRVGEYIANGGFKIGFGMAPKVGQVMARLILAGEDHIPPDFLPAASW